MANSGRISLFISFAHEDEWWLKKLLVWLKPLERTGRIEAWSDQKLAPSDDWKSKIFQAMEEAGVGVCLVSPHFMASDFIMEKELPYLLEARKAGLADLFLIPVTYHDDPDEKLSSIQWACNPDLPLKKAAGARRDFLFREILQKLRPLVEQERKPAFGDGPRSDLKRDRPEYTSPRDTFLTRVSELCELRVHGVRTTPFSLPGGGEYLRLTEPGEFGRSYPLGVFPNGINRHSWEEFWTHVVEPYRQHDRTGFAEAVYGSETVAPDIRKEAKSRRIRLRSLVELQGLIDFNDYMAMQSGILKTDSLYPPELYVDQTAKWEAGFDKGETEAAVQQVLEWLAEPEGRFILILGDFGTGKTFLMHQLALLLSEAGGIVPALIEMRALEKGRTLSELAAQHFTRYRQREYTDDKFRRMLRDGHIVLLFDGFDELALRVTYDRATHHFDTLLSAMEGYARIIVTSRTQHFLTKVEIRNEVERVKKEIFKKAEALSGFHLLELQGFKEKQICEFLVRYMKDEKKAAERLQLICDVKDLHGLAATPRMLGFIADIEAERLQQARDRDGVVTAASLYQEIIDRWFRYEIERLDHPGGTPPLSMDARHEAVTAVALRLWAQIDRTMDVSDLTADVQSALKSFDFLSSGSVVSLSEKEAAHQIGSGTLLVRDEDGKFSFVHQSIMEWLVARHAAKCLAKNEPTGIFEQRQFSPLMVEFFCDLAKDDADKWVLTSQESASTVASLNAQEIARKRNLVMTKEPFRLSPGDDAQGQDFSGRDLQNAHLSGVDLSQARFVETDLRGAELIGATLDIADFTDASLEGAKLENVSAIECRFHGANLRRATFTGADLSRASLIGAKVDETSIQLADRRFGAALPHEVNAIRRFFSSISACRCVAFSADALLLASGHNDGLIRLWDVASGKAIRAFEGHQNWVSGVVFSCDGERLASGSDDKTVRLWDVASGNAIRSFEGHQHGVSSVAFSPDGGWIASGSGDNIVRLWDVASGTAIGEFKGHQDGVSSVAFSPDGGCIASGSGDNIVRLWDVATRTVIRELKGHQYRVSSVAFSPDGEWIVSGSNDGTICLWDAASEKAIQSFEGHHNRVSSVAFSPDGRWIASGSEDNIVRLWDAASGLAIRAFEGHHNMVSSVAFSPDGRWIASGSEDRTVRLWDAASGTAFRTFEGHQNSVPSVAFSPDGRWIASGSDDRTVRLWDAASGKAIQEFEGHQNRVYSVAFSPDGRWIASGSDDRTVRLWDAASGKAIQEFEGHQNRVYSVAFSPDGGRIASGSNDRTVRVWDLASGTAIREFKGHQHWVSSVAFSPDGERIASGSEDWTIRVWDLAGGKAIREFKGHQHWVSSVAFSPDGERIASGSYDRNVRLWDAANGKAIREFEGHQSRVYSVAFSPDGESIASGSADKTIRLWDAANGKAIREFEGHQNRVYSVAFSPDGNRLASGSADNTIRIWEVATGRHLATLLPTPEGWAAFTAEGRYKCGGNVAGSFWYACNLVRFEPSELASLAKYVPMFEPVPLDAPLY